MIVLGINGATNDAAAALLVDGETVCFVEEERICRSRHAVGKPPVGATAAVLAHAGITIDDVDVIAHGYDVPWYYREVRRVAWDTPDNEFVAAATGLRPRRAVPLRWIRHHDAHAASAFYGSGWDQAAVLVADGKGESESSTVYTAGPGGMESLRRWDTAQSLGILYEAATEVCGFGTLDAGKTMGLSSYDDTAPRGLMMEWDGDDIVTPIGASHRATEIHEAWLAHIQRRWDVTIANREQGTALDTWKTRNPAVAGSCQQTTEEVMLGLAAHATRATGIPRLCLSGGVALNCVANGRILDRVEELYVQPASSDGGAALGAAMLVAAQHGDPIVPMARADLGTGYCDAEIADALAATGAQFRHTDDPVGEATSLLTAGKVIGWFQGRMEAGPRALGRRSVLALAHDAAVKNTLNDAKGRERWRPLAPALLSEEAERVFGSELHSPFMLVSLPLTPWALENLPAAAHVDGTARPQTVDRDGSLFRALLESIRSATGAGVLLNTSFNGPGEPIVASPEHALGTFCSSGLDAMVIGSFVLSKSGGK